jgi:hypothetical protein
VQTMTRTPAVGHQRPPRLRPAAVRPHQASNAQLLELQRDAGNQAVCQLLGKHRAAPVVVQRFPTANQFKSETKAFGARDAQLKRMAALIDTYHNRPEAQLQLSTLNELANVITSWLANHGGSKRAPGVRRLQTEVNLYIRNMAKAGIQPAGGTVTAPIDDGNYSEFDGRQFLISGRAPDRVVYEVLRGTARDGSHRYIKTGRVVGFHGNKPIIQDLPQPVPLPPNWYPQVAHLNGMDVPPMTGITSAMELAEGINKTIDDKIAAGGESAALGQDFVEVLYTYSARRGPLLDVYECIVGKFATPKANLGYTDDLPTEQQVEIMMNAVIHDKPVVMSAHSRGTIKTDNAVRIVYKKLRSAPYGLAHVDAINLMESRIRLVYAGNAVWKIAPMIPTTLYVGTAEPVSHPFGTSAYVKNPKSELHHLEGKGHPFITNYIPSVAPDIAEDFWRLRRS